MKPAKRRKKTVEGRAREIRDITGVELCAVVLGGYNRRHERHDRRSGIPIPSSDPVFLAIVGVHVLFGLAAVITGAIAMLAEKGGAGTRISGTTYFWCLAGVFATMGALSIMRWAENYHLFVLGTLSFISALLGRTAARRHWHQWPRVHLTGMGTSYIFMLTAFYVDNGKNLPLWKELPQIAFWLLPGAVGVPLILNALHRHPLVLAFDSQHGHVKGSDKPTWSR